MQKSSVALLRHRGLKGHAQSHSGSTLFIRLPRVARLGSSSFGASTSSSSLLLSSSSSSLSTALSSSLPSEDMILKPQDKTPLAMS